MANFLRYNTETAATNGYIGTNWNGAANGDWSVAIRFSCSSFASNPRIFGITGSTSTKVLLITTNGALSWASVNIISANGTIPLNTKLWVKAESAGETKNLYYSLDDVEFEEEVNWIFIGTSTYAVSSFGIDRIGSAASVYSRVFDFYSVNFTGGTFTDKWDTTTAPSTGTAWPSASGTRNLNLVNFTGTADSWWMFYETVVAITIRALILLLGRIHQITDAELSTGKKPLVLLNGQIKERSTTEGTPIIYDPALAAIRTLAPDETLLI